MSVIYLLRHGEAESLEGGFDRRRQLTEQGRADVLAQGTYIGEDSGHRAAIYHSPYVRTVQSAELVNQAFKVALQPLPALVPSGNVLDVMAAVVGKEGNLVLVTHLPLVAELAMHLTSRVISFRPGTCVRITRADAYAESGVLDWVRHPNRY